MNTANNILSNPVFSQPPIDGRFDVNFHWVVSATSLSIKYYNFGMPMPGRNMNSGDYRYGFQGHEMDNEIKGNGNHYSFGDYGYDSRLGRRWNVDPHAASYPSLSGYSAFADDPLNVIDPDGRDIIVLRNSSGAHGTGHAAILVGNNKDGWTYISKDGYEGSAFGSEPKFVVQKFSSIEEFRNSPHNFVLEDGTHSTSEGKEASSFNYKLDSDGNKIQRYDKALYFGTTQADGSSTDAATIDAATKSASTDYCLMSGDCSDVVTDGLNASKDSEGNQIQNGEANTFQRIMEYPLDERPNQKFDRIESRNESDVNYDAGVKPDGL